MRRAKPGRSVPALTGSILLSMACFQTAADNETASQALPRTSSGVGNAESLPENIKRLVALLQSADADKREVGANHLIDAGPRALPALPFLIPLLEDEADYVCVAAVRAVCAIGPKAAPAVPAMVRMVRRQMSDCQECKCFNSIEAEKIGPAAIPYLLAELGVHRRESGVVVANQLAYIGPESLPAVVQLLEEGGDRFEGALDVIRLMGPIAQAATPALVRALHGGKLSALEFISLLESIEATSAEAIEELERLATSGDSQRTRLDAQQALAKLRPVRK